MGSRLSVDTSRTLTARLEDSLLLDISGLCLGEGGRERSCSPARPSNHCQVVTSTPGMDVDEGPAQSGTESGGPQLEPNHATRKRDTPSLEDQMQELDLADGEGDKVGGTPVRGQNLLLCEGEEGLVEVMACKITAKTKIVFLEKRLEKVKLSRVYTPISDQCYVHTPGPPCGINERCRRASTSETAATRTSALPSTIFLSKG